MIGDALQAAGLKTKIIFSKNGSVTSTLYDMMNEHNTFCKRKKYINLGYWGAGATSSDEAGDALARKLADSVSLGTQDVVLDVGSGFAEQELYWAAAYGPRKILGINIAAKQSEKAQKYVSSTPYGKTIDLQVADACDLPFFAESFDVIFSLESAMHFKTRQQFFESAFRVLKPGGRIAVADIIASDLTLSRIQELKRNMTLKFWQFPKENLWSMDKYRVSLQGVGFSQFQIEDISEFVFPGHFESGKRDAARLISDAQIGSIMKRVLKHVYIDNGSKYLKEMLTNFKYVVVSAIKESSAKRY